MENSSNTNAKENTTPTRFNVVVRLRPELGDEKTDLTTDDEMYVCVSKMVYYYFNSFLFLYNNITVRQRT